MPEKTFQVTSRGNFSAISVPQKLVGSGFVDFYMGFMYSWGILEIVDKNHMDFMFFNITENDAEIIQQVITALVESGYTQISKEQSDGRS